jgi:hypothetical protein
MKKIFSFILVVMMIVGIGVSVLNVTSTNLEAGATESYAWYLQPLGHCVDWLAIDCYIIVVTPAR